MAGPPNTVAIASPIPTGYFGSGFGMVAAGQPSHFQFSGHAQPVIPTIQATLGDLTDFRAGVLPTPTPAPQGRRIQTVLDRFDFTNPVSWWQRQIKTLNFGAWNLGRRDGSR